MFEFFSRWRKKPAKMNFHFQVNSCSVIGGRDENQDYVISKKLENGYALLIADGMGGHSGGKLASKYFSQYLIDEIANHAHLFYSHPEKTITNVFSRARRQMLEKISEIDAQLDPYTTCVATIIVNDKLIFAHLGDSRGILLTGPGTTWQTKDHSMLQMYLDKGLIKNKSQEEKLQSQLLKAIGGNIEEPPDVFSQLINTTDLPIHIVQMTDGFWQHIENNELIKLSNTIDCHDIEKELTTLCKQAVARSGADADNTSIQICKITKTN